MTILQYKYLGPLGIPLIIAGLTLLAKRISSARRRPPGWRLRDFYFGIDLTLASLSIPLLNIVDILNPERAKTVTFATIWLPLVSNLGALLLTVFALLLVLTFHQDHETNTPTLSGQEIFWVFGLANVIGFALLFAWALWVPTIGK